MGKRESINIWQYHWLPRKHPPLVVFYTVESWEIQMVASLINSSTRQWNKDSIDGLIAHEEAKIIKMILLARAAIEDALIWPFSNDGKYNCKSRYHFLKKKVRPRQPLSPGK